MQSFETGISYLYPAVPLKLHSKLCHSRGSNAANYGKVLLRVSLFFLLLRSDNVKTSTAARTKRRLS